MIKSLKRYFRILSGQLKKDEALIDAMLRDDLSDMKKLIDAGANINSEDIDIIYLAVVNNKIEVLKFLAQQGGDLDYPNGVPLFFAICQGNTEAVKTLIKAGANVRRPPNYTRPIYPAIYRGYTEIVKLLAEAGADIGNINFLKLEKEGKSDIAKILKHELEKRKLLRERNSYKSSL